MTVLIIVCAGLMGVALLFIPFRRRKSEKIMAVARELNFSYTPGGRKGRAIIRGKNRKYKFKIVAGEDGLFKECDSVFIRKHGMLGKQLFHIIIQDEKCLVSLNETGYSRYSIIIRPDELKIVHPMPRHQISAKILAFFSGEVRKRILKIYSDVNFSGITFSSDVCSFEYSFGEDISAEKILVIIDGVSELLEMLSDKIYFFEKLKRNFFSEESFPVKLTFFRTIQSIAKRGLPGDEIISEALNSGDPELVFEAVKSVRGAADEYAEKIFNKADNSLRLKILEYARRHKSDTLLPFFITQNNIEDQKIMAALFSYFRNMKRPEAEPVLIEYLERCSKKKDILILCISALGACGTYRSIGLIDRYKTRDNSRIADQAIAAIQDRIGVGSDGWLSTRDGAEGGEVSLDQDKKGQT